MKTKSRYTPVTAMLLAMTVPFGSTWAQQSAPSNVASGDQKVLVLSPFEVTAGANEGYSAATTLAGNRLSTDLRDVGFAISVVTSQLLKDIGATSNESLLQYTTNTEVGGMQGTMANAGNGTQLDETSRFANPNGNTRVRGLTAADSTRDFFLTDIPWDSYNVDRLDLQRGPNAILFGLGSPAGIINAGTKSAGFRNKGEVSFRFDQFGSARTTLDINQVLIKDQLAIRLDVLNNDEKFQQKPAFSRDQRIYGAVRYEPEFLSRGSARTIIKSNFEQGRIRSNRPRTLTPGDAITPWFLTGTAEGFDAAGNPLTYNNLGKIGLNAGGLQDQNIASTGVSDRGQFVKNYSNGALNPYWQPWLGGQFSSSYFGNVMAIFDSGGSSAVRYFNMEPTTTRGIGATGAIDGNITGIPSSRMSSITIYRDISKKVNLPGAKFGLTRNLQLSDPTVFNFYDNLIDGPNKGEWQNFHSFNVSVAETLLDGAAGLEAVYDRQHYDNGQLSFMTDKEQNIFIDMTQTLADGSTNPNFGRPFIAGGTGSNNSNSIDRESYRLTGYLRHDFNKGRNGSVLARLLGKHTLTGLYSHDRRDSDSRNWLRYGTDLAYKDLVSAPATVVPIDNNLRTILPAIYLGPSLANASSASGAYIPRPTATAVATNTGSVRVFDSTWTATSVNPADVWINTLYPVGNARRTSTQSENPANYRGWTDAPVTIIDSENGNRDALTRSAQLTRSVVSSKAFVWQGSLWDGAVVGMYGYRDDIAKAWSRQGARNNLNQVNFDPTSYVLPVTASNRIQDTSNTYSLVAHLSQLFPDRLPVEISAFYGRSSNFQALAGRVDPYNVPLDAPKGDTKDYGILLATKDGRYSLKISKYESTVINASGNSFNVFLLGGIFAQGQNFRNVFKYDLGGFTLDTANQGDPSRYTYQPGPGQTQAQADAQEAAAIAGWEALVAKLPPAFFNAWGLDFSTVRQYTATTPIGLAQPEDDISKGYEIEFSAQPVKNLRLIFNASKTDVVRRNIAGQSMGDLVDVINTALNTTAAGDMRIIGGSGSTATTTLQDWNASFYATYSSFKVQEGSAVPEFRKWRANMIANYDFTEGWLKGVSIGGAYRWQDKVILGYTPIYLNGVTPTTNAPAATGVTYDISKPYYGPSEGNIDLWIGYERRLSSKLGWRTQLNVRNVGQGESLIPITVQADGSVAGWRIAPTQVWTLTNTITF